VDALKTRDSRRRKIRAERAQKVVWSDGETLKAALELLPIVVHNQPKPKWVAVRNLTVLREACIRSDGVPNRF
jgi:hypothetical protein